MGADCRPLVGVERPHNMARRGPTAASHGYHLDLTTSSLPTPIANTMLPVITRATFAFLGAIAFYLAYDLLVAPQLIPPIAVQVTARSGATAKTVLSDVPQPWRAHFPTDHWVWDSRTKALITQTGTLLFRTRTDQGQGRVKLAPLALVIEPPGNDDEASTADDSRQGPIILEAHEGAVLEFEGDLRLGRGGIGRLEVGKVVGPVTIYSQMRVDDTSDDLVIRTRDVKINERLISTPHRVDFAFGPHRGGGRRMEIRLVSRQPYAAKPSPDVPLAGVLWIEILNDVRASLVLADPGAEPSGSGGLDQFASASPIEITCQGSFYVQVDKLQARFEEDVEVFRAEANGPANQLSCELLAIDFENSSAAATETSPETSGVNTQPRRQPAQLRVRRLTAKGAPVIVRLATHNIVARGEQLTIDIPLQQIDLSSSLLAEGSSIQRGLSEIRAPT